MKRRKNIDDARGSEQEKPENEFNATKENTHEQMRKVSLGEN